MAESSKKFNLTELLNQRSKEIAQQETATEKDTTTDGVSTTADIEDLIPSKDNFYSVEDVQNLKQSIELLGILQPLLVTKENDKWRIIAGHRRRIAIMQLVDEGKERFRNVPIMVKQTKNAILDRLALIMTNRFREKTDWEKMTESIETEKLVQELKEQMDIPGRTRDLLAEIIETSPAQLGRYKAIYNNLTAELMAEFKAGKIGVSVIYEISQLEKEWQLQSLEVFRENGTLALPDVKKIKRQQKPAAQIPGQMGLDDITGQKDTQEAAQTEETWRVRKSPRKTKKRQQRAQRKPQRENMLTRSRKALFLFAIAAQIMKLATIRKQPSQVAMPMETAKKHIKRTNSGTMRNKRRLTRKPERNCGSSGKKTCSRNQKKSNMKKSGFLRADTRKSQVKH